MEEEEKAIERIEKWLNKEESYCTDEDIKIVLNLIETQKAEIKDIRSAKNIMGDVVLQLTEEMKKKNKMIDLMARVIVNLDDQLVINHYKDKEQCIEYFTKLAEEGK